MLSGYSEDSTVQGYTCVSVDGGALIVPDGCRPLVRTGYPIGVTSEGGNIGCFTWINKKGDSFGRTGWIKFTWMNFVFRRSTSRTKIFIDGRKVADFETY
jgi:hypothetical protein